MSLRLLASTLVLALAAWTADLRGQGGVPALQETEPELLRVLAPEDPFLQGVREAAFRGETLAVLSSPGPAIFLFEADGVTTWGGEGRGPSEFMNPGDLIWIGDRLLVWDYDLVKIASFDAEGTLTGTRRFAGLPIGHLSASAGDTLVSLFSWSGGARYVVRLAGSVQDTLLTLPPVAEKITLRADGSPSLTLPAPFAPSATWASLPGGGIVFWDGESRRLQRLDLDGQRVGHLALPTKQYPITAEDRTAWFRGAIPSGDIAGRGDIFRALRATAHDEVVFPTRFPVVLDLIGDPRGGVWVRRTPATRGEVWTYVDERGPRVTLHFRAGREVLAVSATELAVKAVDALGVESVEVYRNPKISGVRR